MRKHYIEGIGEYFLYAVLLFLIGYFVFYKYYSRFFEGFSVTRRDLKTMFKVYNDKLYPFTSKITKYEEEYIISCIDMINDDDVNINKEISPYSFGVTIDNNFDKINYSRFNIGNKTNNKKYEKILTKLINNLDIKVRTPNNYKYYGVGWDLEDNILKIHFINNNNKKLLCYVYDVKRKNRTISDINFVNMKYYYIGSEKTTMFKLGKKVNQINCSKNMDYSKYIEKYPAVRSILKKMENYGFDIDSYSEYDNKLNLYFD